MVAHFGPTAREIAMVKVILLLMLAIVLAIGIAYYHGGVRSFDPTAQGEKAKAAISPGMTWQQVITAAGPPLKFAIKYQDTSASASGLTQVKDGVPMRFERKLFDDTVARGLPTDGFRFVYFFNAQVAFTVHFDPNGAVEDIVDDKTVADLLGTRK
jgi:hypothetical protein